MEEEKRSSARIRGTFPRLIGIESILTPILSFNFWKTGGFFVVSVFIEEMEKKGDLTRVILMQFILFPFQIWDNCRTKLALIFLGI